MLIISLFVSVVRDKFFLCRPLICALFAAAGALIASPAISAATADCVPVGSWVLPRAAGAKPVASGELLARFARQSVVLLGEMHESAEHHRWQLQTLTALHVLRPNLVLAFEMFPRRVQPVLDRWVAGELTEAQFLAEVDWKRVWTVDPQLYLPLFHFARMNRVPMVAMNVDHELVHAVDAKGFDGVPADQREGITQPAAPTAAYLEFLDKIYRGHGHAGHGTEKTDGDDPAFRRFVESQQLWDRAMAQSIAAAAARQGAPLVVGILGAGHVIRGFGVPHQLKDLGVANVSWLLPWDHNDDCEHLTADYATAVFGVGPAAAKDAASQRPRLGILLDTEGNGLRVQQVLKGSVAETAGMRDGDVVSEAAGVSLKEFADLRAIVERQVPGTWLPLKVKRQNDTLDIIAKFPPAKP